MAQERVFWVVAMLVSSKVALADTTYSVSIDPDDWSFRTFYAGEVQSTVVPPHKSLKCPQGRFLTSTDAERPVGNGTYLIRGKDLGSDKVMVATIKAIGAGAENYDFVTNDHDLVTLPNGDVVYLIAAASKRPPSSGTKPAWWKYTYRGEFGPGAHAVLLAWLSTDCGESFSYRGEFDPLEAGDASCVNPQGSNTGSTGNPRYDMGGCDGQTVSVDPGSGDLYLTFSCVGYTVDTSASPFGLTTTPLNKTLVARSSNKGQSWTTLGSLPVRRWRSEAVALRTPGIATPTALAEEVGTGVMIGALGGAGISSPTFTQVIPNETLHQGIPQVYANLVGYQAAILVDGPQPNTLILAAPDSIPGKPSPRHGYQVFSLTRSGQKIIGQTTLEPVVPQGADADSFVLHLTAANAGGAMLLYWADIDAKTMSATIRGRAIFSDGSMSKDFAISTSNGAPRSFALSPYKMCDTASSCWYGDYWTASGFTTSSKTVTSSITTHTFAPVWVDPTTGRTSFNVVRVVAKTTPTFKTLGLDLGSGFKNLELIPIKKPGPPPVERRLGELRASPVVREVRPHRLEVRPEVERR